MAHFRFPRHTLSVFTTRCRFDRGCLSCSARPPIFLPTRSPPVDVPAVPRPAPYPCLACVLGLVRHEFLEPGVFLLQRLEPFGRLFLGPAEFLPSSVAGRRANLHLLAHDIHALGLRPKAWPPRAPFVMISSDVCLFRFMLRVRRHSPTANSHSA